MDMTPIKNNTDTDIAATMLDAIAQVPAQDDDTTLKEAWLLGFDTETTGTGSTDAIVSASLVLRDPTRGYEGDVVAERVINPHRHISAGASRVNGFTDEFLEANGAQPTDAIAAIGSIVSAAQTKHIPLLAYNAPFDVRMLAGDLKRWNLEALPDELLVVDPLVIDREISHRHGKRTLTYTTEYYGVEPHGDFHDATADTTAAVDLIRPMSTLYPQVGNLRLGDLMDWQRQAHKKWKDSFNLWMESRGRRPITDSWL
ncbi:exonuclease domain-containing protein [Bifidobacterium sp. ESL0798]|uniref:exonuclease domain-containing protein n=1 Tax=Bifidobacterium sp. ESL0798 TaxID=2983235 RepID=UPI0023F71400|nr:exonuclease domain-containing protein [Bifidobacterium sp. ESL0798]WEV73539.1 exonuclease domain-containing protein [Bifidobacterium sp. ESL0798]